MWEFCYECHGAPSKGYKWSITVFDWKMIKLVVKIFVNYKCHEVPEVWITRGELGGVAYRDYVTKGWLR